MAASFGQKEMLLCVNDPLWALDCASTRTRPNDRLKREESFCPSFRNDPLVPPWDFGGLCLIETPSRGNALSFSGSLRVQFGSVGRSVGSDMVANSLRMVRSLVCSRQSIGLSWSCLWTIHPFPKYYVLCFVCNVICFCCSRTLGMSPRSIEEWSVTPKNEAPSSAGPSAVCTYSAGDKWKGQRYRGLRQRPLPCMYDIHTYSVGRSVGGGTVIGWRKESVSFILAASFIFIFGNGREREREATTSNPIEKEKRSACLKTSVGFAVVTAYWTFPLRTTRMHVYKWSTNIERGSV